MFYGFEWWWIFPLACFGLMLLGMIFFSRMCRGFYCRPYRGWPGRKDQMSKLEQEIHKPREYQNKTED